MPVIERFAARFVRPASRRPCDATGARRSAPPAASSPQSGPASRRRRRSLAGARGSRRRAPPLCRGERSHDPAPARRDGRHGKAWPAARARRVAASILDADLSNLAYAVRQVQAGRRRSDPSRRDGRPLRPEPDVRSADHQAPPAADRAAARRPPDGRRAGPLHRRVPRRRLRLDHLPRRDRGEDRADVARDPGRRPRRRAGRQARDAAVRARAVRRAARHRPGDDRRARLRWAGAS